MKSIGRIAVGTLCVSAACAFAAEIDLAGTWRLERADDPSVTCEIVVPGGVHSALFKAGLMPDSFWGRNELKIQEIGRKDWIVSRQFEVGDETLAKRAIVLRLDNVDTFATISLNGHELGKTDNRFRRWEYAIKPYLKRGTNELKGVFESSELKANEIAKGYDHKFPMSNVPWAKNQALVRKPACHAGWDWGLAQMITGFCGETKILAYDDCKVDYIYSTQEFNSDFTHCDLTVYVEVTAEFWSFDGRILQTKTRKVSLASDSVMDWGGGVLAASDVKEPSFLVLTLRTKFGVFQNDWMFDYYKTYDLADADVKAAVNGFNVTLSTDKPAFFVWANAKGIRGEFSDNSFTLLPNRPVEITFTPKGNVSPDDFKRVFSVTHLRMTY